MGKSAFDFWQHFSGRAAMVWVMLRATAPKPTTSPRLSAPAPHAKNILIKKSLQPMVLRELSELHATVIFFTGYTDGSLEENVEMVLRQLKRGDVFIVYDEATETANIVPKDCQAHLR